MDGLSLFLLIICNILLCWQDIFIPCVIQELFATTLFALIRGEIE
jgi:hypothetical protein